MKKLTLQEMKNSSRKSYRDKAKKIEEDLLEYDCKDFIEKMNQTKKLIIETPIEDNAKKIIDYITLYQKLYQVINTPKIETEAEKPADNIFDKLVNEKNN